MDRVATEYSQTIYCVGGMLGVVKAQHVQDLSSLTWNVLARLAWDSFKNKALFDC